MSETHTHAQAEHEHDHGEHDHDPEHDHDHGEGEEHGPVDAAAEERAQEREREALRRRALVQIRQYPDVALRMKAREVTEFDQVLADLAARMTTLMGDAQGVGLAATQVGILERMFVFTPSEEQGSFAVVNPRIVESSEETETDEEGCLSLPEVRVPVERALRVRLEGVDPSGNRLVFELEGLSARAVQHELDHLDGVLIIDRTDEEHRREALGLLRPQIVLR